ncbi:hypothetical protein G4Y79_16255 [Phototrophicus methaneseepsis]|uniref:Uncharacterized protein n=1 Tax=Phototrophicus methaneseepsis TaxID=2710758 RepID=A0A7S8IDD7_9CHLR|nr:hypothetical protein [Phototrophicus methaneseepsis]QPC81254.1 hypothetical protein G4Y79_16255 [Phototrophicus methaneseepsis]
MSSLTLKRLLVVVLSQILGAVITFLIITVGFDLLPYITSAQASKAVSIETYGTIYFLVTSVPIGVILMIWMDRFLDTKILPD